MKIPNPTITRLSLYYRVLQPLAQQGVRQISSRNLAELLAVNPALIRKDFSYFGTFGTRGAGYNVIKLYRKISEILGVSEEHRVAIVGAGNMGKALAAYRGFGVIGFNMMCLFDNDKNKIGKKINGIPCYSIDVLEEKVRKMDIHIAVLAVPMQAAQEMAYRIVKSGIKAILNFAQVNLNVPENIKVSNVDMALELRSLSFFMAEGKKKFDK